MKARTTVVAAVVVVLVLLVSGLTFPRLTPGQEPSLTRGEEPKSMYVSVRRYEGVPNPTEAAKWVREDFVPIISQIPGFIAYYWVDVGGGVMISTSVFESQAAAEESNRKLADWRAKNKDAKRVLPNPPQITAGKVVAYKAK